MIARRRRYSPSAVIAAVLVATLATSASASGSGMPWEAPLQQVLESVQGPVAKIIAVIIIITTGLTLAFGETSGGFRRSEEHTSELQSLMRISYAVFCLKKKKKNNNPSKQTIEHTHKHELTRR